MKIYDDVNIYIEETIEQNIDELTVDEAKVYAIAHISCFVTWLAKNNYIKYENILESDIATNYLLNNCNGIFEESILKKEIIPFVGAFYENYFALYKKNVVNIIEDLPLEFILTFEHYNKLEFMFNEAFYEFNNTGSIEEALSFINDGKYDEAITILKILSKQDDVALFQLGLILYFNKNDKSAITLLNSSLSNLENIITYISLFDNNQITEEESGITILDLLDKAVEFNHIEYIIKAAELKMSNNNSKLGVNLYNKAARLGSSFAQNKVGECYFNAIGITKNYSRAVKWFSKSTEADALCNLGICCEEGLGIDVNASKALTLYKEAKEKGCIKANYYLAMLYIKNKTNENEIFELIKYAAENDFVLALERYAHFLYNGIYSNANESLGYDYYIKAANLDNCDACFALGNIIKEEELSKEYFKKAASLNHPEASYKMSLLSDGITAKNYMEKSANLGFIDAIVNIECFNINHSMTNPVSREKSIKYLQDVNTKEAIHQLGLCYLTGLGFNVDLDKAIELLTKASKLGLEIAKLDLKKAKIEKLKLQ